MKPILAIPENNKIIETSSSVYWYADGVVYYLGKKAKPISVEEAERLLADWQQLANHKPFGLLADVTDVIPATKVIREYAALVFPKEIVAIALLSSSPLGRMVAQLFITFKPQSYPTQIFSTEKEAKEWLDQQLKR
jgi:hypothetical protein